MESKLDPEKFKSSQKAAWTSVAEGWHVGLAPSLVPVSERLISFVGIPHDAKVLDLACGDGTLALHTAAAGAKEVIASDIAPTFGPIIARRATAAGLENVRFEEADMEALPFEEKYFDIVLCQFGLMFAPERRKALQEIYRVLKPEGKFGAAVWCVAEMNPGCAPILKILVDRLPPRPEGTPTLFECGIPGLLQNELHAIGFRKYQEAVIDVTFRHRDADSGWAAWRDNGPFAAAVAQWDEKTQKEVEQQVREHQDRFRTEKGSIEVPAKALLLSARRSFETLRLE